MYEKIVKKCSNVNYFFHIYLIIKSAIVLVTVSVYGAEETSTTTGKSSQTDLLLTNKTTVLLLLPVFVSVVWILAWGGSDIGGCWWWYGGCYWLRHGGCGSLCSVHDWSDHGDCRLSSVKITAAGGEIIFVIQTVQTRTWGWTWKEKFVVERISITSIISTYWS